MKYPIQSFALSDIGLSRSNNEDVWGMVSEKNFFALADGMGGHRGGEVAAKKTIELLLSSIKQIDAQDPLELLIELRYAIEQVNLHIYNMGKKHPELAGMGTTLCCLIWTEEKILYAHVGDSRIYRLRNQKLTLLTEDHSLLAKWLATGRQSRTPFPYKNVITRAIGSNLRALPEMASATHELQDLYLLCTDGLSDVLSLREIEKVLNASCELEEKAERLIERAKIKGSSDNITLLLIQSGAYATDLSR